LKARLFWLLVLTVALVALPAAALGSTARTTVNSQSFPDSTGEDANAPDITSTTVSNDDAGQITFKINISNRPAMTSDMVIVVFLNTDQNTATGDPDVLGTDYLIELDPGVVGLFKWDGTTYSPADSQTSLTFGYDATGATLHVSAADLGQTKGFSFAVVAVSGITTDANGDPDFTNAHRDLSPDAGHGFFRDRKSVV